MLLMNFVIFLLAIHFISDWKWYDLWTSHGLLYFPTPIGVYNLQH